MLFSKKRFDIYHMLYSIGKLENDMMSLIYIYIYIYIYNVV